MEMENESPSKPRFGRSFWLVIASVGLLMAFVAVPNFIKARATRAKNPCIANLKQIDGAVQQWALENNKTATDTYSLSDTTLLQYLKNSRLPVCREGGRYLPGSTVSATPRCTLGGDGHSL